MPRKPAKSRTEIREAEPPAEFDQAEDRVSSTSMGSEPNEEDIRMRAYQKFIDRGGGHGSHVDDWVSAERELREKKK